MNASAAALDAGSNRTARYARLVSQSKKSQWQIDHDLSSLCDSRDSESLRRHFTAIKTTLH